MPESSHSQRTAYEQLDQQVHASLANASSSLSIASALLAVTDWALHLAVSPGKCTELGQLALSQSCALVRYALNSAHGKAPAPLATERRFSAPEWQQWPFNTWHQSFLQTEKWWQAASTNIWGVSSHHQAQVAFAARNLLDVASPANQFWTNPEVLRATVDQGGCNLVRGACLAMRDWQQGLAQHQPAPSGPHQQMGQDLANTPGKVVMRNDLIELLQYAPAGEKVYAEPVLLVPAWIMKYYILDLTAQTSLVRYLVDHGHTVFCISWRNPGPEQSDLDMDDYLRQGWFAALDKVGEIMPRQGVHAAGYCLGGTLLAIAAAAMARAQDQRLASLTLLTAQTDFTEPGELGLFIDDSQLGVLEAQMQDRGVLRAEQMAGAFQLLRANDLLWSRMVRRYLLGEEEFPNDLMAWNADATRMPARMHSQYLRRLFLGNDLAAGRYTALGNPVALGDITLPAFMVATQSDHVAPWRSVYKFHALSRGEITFVLCSGGHNTGIVSPPGTPHRQYQIHTHAASAHHLSPDEWLDVARREQGSWWPAWQSWLAARSGPRVAPPRLASTGADAPGEYVMEK